MSRKRKTVDGTIAKVLGADWKVERERIANLYHVSLPPSSRIGSTRGFAGAELDTWKPLLISGTVSAS